MEREIMVRAKTRAENEAGGTDGLSDRDRELLDIGVRCGVAETLDLIHRMLR